MLAAVGPETITSGLTAEQRDSGQIGTVTLTSLGRIRGPYAEVKAAWERQQQAGREQRDARDRLRQDRNARAGRAKDVLNEHGIFATFHGDRLELTLENAEKLAALLTRVFGPED